MQQKRKHDDSTESDQDQPNPEETDVPEIEEEPEEDHPDNDQPEEEHPDDEHTQEMEPDNDQESEHDEDQTEQSNSPTRSKIHQSNGTGGLNHQEDKQDSKESKEGTVRKPPGEIIQLREGFQTIAGLREDFRDFLLDSLRGLMDVPVLVDIIAQYARKQIADLFVPRHVTATCVFLEGGDVITIFQYMTSAQYSSVTTAARGKHVINTVVPTDLRYASGYFRTLDTVGGRPVSICDTDSGITMALADGKTLWLSTHTERELKDAYKATIHEPHVPLPKDTQVVRVVDSDTVRGTLFLTDSQVVWRNDEDCNYDPTRDPRVEATMVSGGTHIVTIPDRDGGDADEDIAVVLTVDGKVMTIGPSSDSQPIPAVFEGDMSGVQGVRDVRVVGLTANKKDALVWTAQGEVWCTSGESRGQGEVAFGRVLREDNHVVHKIVGTTYLTGVLTEEGKVIVARWGHEDRNALFIEGTDPVFWDPNDRVINLLGSFDTLLFETELGRLYVFTDEDEMYAPNEKFYRVL